jgi:hypothetical protein
MNRIVPILMIALFAVMASAFSAGAQGINVTYAGKESGIVTWKEIAADSMLHVKQSGVVVISFEMKHFQAGWDVKEFHSSNNQITPQMRKEFKHLHGNDLLFFTHIKAINATGDTLWAHPLQFKIK